MLSKHVRLTLKTFKSLAPNAGRIIMSIKNVYQLKLINHLRLPHIHARHYTIPSPQIWYQSSIYMFANYYLLKTIPHAIDTVDSFSVYVCLLLV